MSSSPTRSAPPSEHARRPSRDLAKRLLRYPSQQFRGRIFRKVSNETESVAPARPSFEAPPATANGVIGTGHDDKRSEASTIKASELQPLLSKLSERVQFQAEDREALKTELEALRLRTTQNEEAIAVLQRSIEQLLKRALADNATATSVKDELEKRLENALTARNAAVTEAESLATRLREMMNVNSRLKDEQNMLKDKYKTDVTALKDTIVNFRDQLAEVKGKSRRLSVSSYLMSPKKLASVDEAVLSLTCVDADEQVLQKTLSWLHSKEVALTLNLKLGYTPVWQTGATGPENAIKVFLGIWYGRFDEERSKEAAMVRTKDLGFCIGILPVEIDGSATEIHGDDVEGKFPGKIFISVILRVSTNDYSILELQNEVAIELIAKTIRAIRS